MGLRVIIQILILELYNRNNTFPFDGKIGEARLKDSALSANWITTEYNNQNDEAAFWGTWTDAGGGATANNSARRMLLMQM